MKQTAKGRMRSFSFNLLMLIFLLSACSVVKAENKQKHVLDGHYHGEFSLNFEFKDVLHYRTMTTGFDVAQHLSCKGMVAQVEIGIVVTDSEVAGRTLNLVDASEVRSQCVELLNGYLTGRLDSDGNFRGWEMVSFSSVKTFQPRLIGSIREGSIFEVREWELRSNKFNWIKGEAEVHRRLQNQDIAEERRKPEQQDRVIERNPTEGVDSDQGAIKRRIDKSKEEYSLNDLTSDLKKLDQLREDQILTENEFQMYKKKLINRY